MIMRSQPRILIMAGGTGGHVFPALTIAQELRAQGSHIEWLGTRAGIEARVLSHTDIPLHCISMAGLRGKGLLRKLLAPFMLMTAFVQSLRVISKLKPSCVLGMGGYVTGPGGLAARVLGKPLLIHEQNAVAGMANAMLFPLAWRALEGFPGAFVRKLGTRAEGQKKILYVGNPVRADILAIAPPAERLLARKGPLRMLVIGGSLGASVFNELVPAALAGIGGDIRPEVRHQCGRGKLTATLQAYSAAGLAGDDHILVSEFIEDMAEAYAWADIVLCRAGASTLAEIAAIGLPAVLVPYPFAVDDHQAANAQALVKVGAATMLSQNALTPQTLRDVLLQCATDRQRLLQQAQAALGASKRDAGLAVARLCLEACHG